MSRDPAEGRLHGPAGTIRSLGTFLEPGLNHRAHRITISLSPQSSLRHVVNPAHWGQGQTVPNEEKQGSGPLPVPIQTWRTPPDLPTSPNLSQALEGEWGHFKEDSPKGAEGSCEDGENVPSAGGGRTPEGTNPADTLMLDFQPPQPREGNFCCFRLQSEPTDEGS